MYFSLLLILLLLLLFYLLLLLFLLLFFILLSFPSLYFPFLRHKQKGLQAVQSILEWGWDQLSREPDDLEQMRMVVKCSLGILSSHIKEVYPAKGTCNVCLCVFVNRT